MEPVTLERLRTQPPGVDRYRAVAEYIAAGEVRLREARKLGDDDLRHLSAEHGPAEAARLTGVSVSTVKRAVGRP